MSKKRIGYARVSGLGQDLKVQVEVLKNEGCDVIYKEKYTGTKTDRPEFNKVLEELNEGDTLVVAKLDRLARNTQEGIVIIEGLFKKGVKVHVLNVGLLENTTMGKFFMQTMLAVAEMERNMIVERTQEGKEYAKRNNPNFKEGRPKTPKKQLDHAMELLKDSTYKEVSEVTGISVSTLTREKRRRVAEGTF